MPEENKENPAVKNSLLVNDLLMKPFSLGWTREVVKRLVTNNRTPNCDIYYFSPNKKKLRSLTEVKCNLTDGLSPECFSFKREPLGLSPDLETVRDAKARGKGLNEKSKEKKRTSFNRLQKQEKSEKEEEEAKDHENESKKKTAETNETDDVKPSANCEVVENEEKPQTDINKENPEEKKDSKNEPETKSRRAKSNVKQSNESKTFSSKKRTKTKSKPKTAKPTKPIRLQSVKRRKAVLKKVRGAKQAKQSKLVASKNLLKGIVSKKVVAVASLKNKLSKNKINRRTTLKTKKNNATKLKAAKKPIKSRVRKGKNEVAKEQGTNETDKKSATRDLKSIVKKNIVKYREMREKQKLGVVKGQSRTQSRKTPIATVSRPRPEPISKNKSLYIKPLEKGWRRELVFRSNCAKAGQQADVYYFHPSGKKLRSFREISENLTHGLTIEYFTFRKEPIGCGEPSEVIRNARSNHKN